MSATITVPEPIRRIARNSAQASDNKIHSEDEARRYGYGGALVPGVTVYAYLSQLVVPSFGADWLAHGAARVRFLRPVYEGQTLVCSAAAAEEDGGPALALTCAREDGTICADGMAWLPSGATDALVNLPPLPDIAPPAVLPQLTPETVPLGVPLAPSALAVTAESVAAYADETDDPSPWYRGPSPFGPPAAPPGIIAGRQARVIRDNFTFGPSIHYSSEIRHLNPLTAGTALRSGGVIVETYERKGNHYLVMDALSVADGTPAARVRHTVIFKVRER